MESPARLRKARFSFSFFTFFNTISFGYLNGSLLILFALKIGASNTTIGILSAISFMSFFFMPMGKHLIKKYHIITVYSRAWLCRGLSMTLVLFSPWLFINDHQILAILFVLVGNALFNMFRGVGMIGNNPVMASLSEGSGKFIMSLLIISNIASMLLNIITAFYLGKEASFTAFIVVFVIGILSSIISSWLLSSLPEPVSYKPKAMGHFFTLARDSFRDKDLRLFFVALITLSFCGNMIKSFLPVYARIIFSQGDDAVILYAFGGNLGVIVMGLLARLLIDRLGSKPLYIIFTGVTLASFIGPMFEPNFNSLLSIMIFLGGLNFFINFGIAGAENTGQTYYFRLIPREKNLEMSIVYFITYGIGGALGSMFGGFYLEALNNLHVSNSLAFRIFFATAFFIVLIIIIKMYGLKNLGAATVRESLSVIISVRDLRAFGLIDQLKLSGDPNIQVELIRKVGRTARVRSQKPLLSYLHSPRFDVRMEALLALEKIPHLQATTITALIEEVKKHPFTTAFIAARILGKKHYHEQSLHVQILECLRAAVTNDDYMLQSSAVVALARLDDRASIPLIEEVMCNPRRNRVRLACAYALELLDAKTAVPSLLACILNINEDPRINDEFILATAKLLGMLKEFYPAYTTFLTSEDTGTAMLIDAATRQDNDEEVLSENELHSLCQEFLGENPTGQKTAYALLNKKNPTSTDLLLADISLNAPSLYKGFRFFILAYLALNVVLEE